MCVCVHGLYKCGSWLSRLCRAVDRLCVCVCVHGLYKCGSWLSRLCRAVDNIPDSGARRPQGRQAGQIWGRLKPRGPSWHRTRTWHPEEARALHHGAKHTVGLRNFIMELNTHLAQVPILQLNPHSDPRKKQLMGSRGTQSNCRPSCCFTTR